MSFTTRDVRCALGHVQISAVYRVSDGPPACTTCAGPTTPFYATREQAGQAASDQLDATLAQFGTVTIDGKKMDRDELATFKKEYADNQGVAPESLDFTSVGNRKEKADEHRHRAWLKRKANGYDENMFRQHQRGEH